MVRFFGKPESTTMPTDSGTDPKKDVALMSDDVATQPESKPVTATMTPEEIDRINKLGILLVNMGVSDEAKVFGSTSSATMREFRARKTPDLIIVHHPEHDLPVQGVRWFKPWTWFSGGQQVSPARWADAACVSGSAEAAAGQPPSALGMTRDEETQTSDDNNAIDTDRKATIEAAVDAHISAQKKESDTQKHGGRRRRRQGLPPVTLEALTDKQVEQDLTPNVRADREKLLESEKRIHELLQGIEDTRFRYLVPSTEIQCEKQVMRVVKCYDKQNRAAAERLRAEAASRNAQNDLLPVALRASAEDEERIAKRAVNYEVLACGEHVQALRRCADDMATAYSKGEAMKP